MACPVKEDRELDLDLSVLYALLMNYDICIYLLALLM